MTSIICTGTLYSDWQNILPRHLPANSSQNDVSAEISALSRKICKRQYPDSDELDWKAFIPDDEFKDQAKQLLSNVESESLFAWQDNNSSLFLDFWNTAAESARFLLIYSSPEFELSQYISSHTFDPEFSEKVIAAWLIRTRAMLSFFMNNRDRCLLVGVETVNAEDGALSHLVDKQFALNLAFNPRRTSQPGGPSALIEFLATTLLLNESSVAELYDEVRSAASLIREQDKSIAGIGERNKSLINAFIDEVTAYQNLDDKQEEYDDELSRNLLQLHQTQKELEFYYLKASDAEILVDQYRFFLSKSKVNKLARLLRLTSPPEQPL